MATDLGYALGMLQVAAAACALREASTDEERLDWGLLTCLGRR